MKFFDRFKEASSWAGIAAACVGVGVQIPVPQVQVAAGIVGGLASILAFFIPEAAKVKQVADAIGQAAGGLKKP